MKVEGGKSACLSYNALQGNQEIVPYDSRVYSITTQTFMVQALGQVDWIPECWMCLVPTLRSICSSETVDSSLVPTRYQGIIWC